MNCHRVKLKNNPLLFLLGFRFALDAVCDGKSLLDGLARFDFSFQIASEAILRGTFS
jgi:hypothetical protein